MVSVVINYPHIENLGDFLRLILMSLHVFGTISTITDSCLSQKVLILRINKDPMDVTDRWNRSTDFTLILISSTFYTNDESKILEYLDFIIAMSCW